MPLSDRKVSVAKIYGERKRQYLYANNYAHWTTRPNFVVAVYFCVRGQHVGVNIL